SEGPLRKFVAPVVMTGHDGHVLQMAFAALIAHWAVVRMILHHAFDNAGAKSDGFRIGDGDARTLSSRSHASHDQAPMLVFLVAEVLYGALAACTHGTQGGMPAEVRQVKTGGEAGVQQVLLGIHSIRLVIHIDGCQFLPPGTALLANVAYEIVTKILERAL